MYRQSWLKNQQNLFIRRRRIVDYGTDSKRELKTVNRKLRIYTRQTLSWKKRRNDAEPYWWEAVLYGKLQNTPLTVIPTLYVSEVVEYLISQLNY
jgi:hypothetical protein